MRAKTGETEVTETMKKTGDEAEVEIAMMTDVEESHPVGKKILGKKKRNVIVITIEDEIKRNIFDFDSIKRMTFLIKWDMDCALYYRQITLKMGYHFSSRPTATLNLCLVHFKIT